MKVLYHLYKKFKKKTLYIIPICLGVALGRVLILRTVNNSMQNLNAGNELFFGHVLLAIIGLVILLILQPLYYRKGILLLEQLALHYRIQFGQKIANTSLHKIEAIGEYPFVSSIVHHLGFLSHNMYRLVMFVQSVFEWLFVSLYVAFYISATITLAVLTGVACLVLIIHFLNARLRDLTTKMKHANEAYATTVKDLILGFKELKVNHRKQADLKEKQSLQLNTLHDTVSQYLILTDDIQYYFRMITYSLLGAVVFILPALLQWPRQQAIQAALAVLFLGLPLLRIVNHWGYVVLLDTLLEQVLDLKKLIDAPSAQQDQLSTPMLAALPFKNQLTLKDITFTYPAKNNQTTYTVGPINLTIPKGEVLFIIGGNGSGKSTILKVLTGLYRHSKGSILVDQKMITDKNTANYRELFAAVFTDFYLSDQILGTQKVNAKKANHLLTVLGLKEKTKVKGNQFTNINLSTGQRKRLAILGAFLENKEIYIFDEVAADQDPEHRKLFYEFILPDIKAAGKTVIVVSHDEHYFHTADRILEMKAGQLVPYQIVE